MILITTTLIYEKFYNGEIYTAWFFAYVIYMQTGGKAGYNQSFEQFLQEQFPYLLLALN